MPQYITDSNFVVVEYGRPETFKEFDTFTEAKRFAENTGAPDEFFILNRKTGKTIDYYDGNWFPSDDPIGL